MQIAPKPPPLPRRRRFPLMDGLRGFALLGILLVNLPSMAAPHVASGPFTLWNRFWDVLGQDLIYFFGAGSFYVLFSLLFGAGVHFMAEKRRRQRRAFLAPYLRRLFFLACLGGLHVRLLWFGDILLCYAAMGMVLLCFLKRKDNTLLIGAAVFALIPLIYYMATLSLLQSAVRSGAVDLVYWETMLKQETWQNIRELVEGYRQTSFGAVAETRLSEFRFHLYTLLMFSPLALAAMLGGIWLARKGVLSHPEDHRVFYHRLLWTSLPLAVLGKGLFIYSLHNLAVVPDSLYLVFLVGMTIGGPALSLVYLCLWQKWMAAKQGSKLCHAFTRAGRCSLTLYLSQSLIAAFIFYGFGLGLYGSVSPPLLILLGLLIFGLQLLGSYWWLRTFRQGPLEWLLRKFTYFRPF